MFLAAAAGLMLQPASGLPLRVARLSYLDGSVIIRPAGVDDSAAATLNYPLYTGDQLWTNDASYAEVHIGASAVHLAPQTVIAVEHLTGSVARLSLTRGALNVRIPLMDQNDVFGIDTPAGAITVRHPGAYRIDVTPEGDFTLVTVRSGDAEVAAGGQTLAVEPGQALRLTRGDPVTAESVPAAETDPWDEWCMSRDQQAESSMAVSEEYIPPEMAGAEDMGQYGDWEVDASYGAVWTPRGMPPDWCPYRFGRWIYKAPWGWTWVDDAPWGFAPFHYGQWVNVRGVWEWAPGPRGIRPLYSPAQVAFVSGWGAGLVAWIPLAPKEDFRSRALNAPYINHAWATAVPADAFAGAQAVAPARTRNTVLNPRAAGAPDVQPRTESYLGRTVAVPPPVTPPAAPVTPQVAERAEPVWREVPVVDHRQEAEQRANDQRRADEQRRADDQRRQEEQQRANEQRRADDQHRQEQQQRAQEQQQREAQRQAESQRQAEAQRQESQRQESQRQAAAQRQEAQNRADEQRRQDDQRQSSSRKQ